MKLEAKRLEKCYAAIEGRLSTPVEKAAVMTFFERWWDLRAAAGCDPHARLAAFGDRVAERCAVRRVERLQGQAEDEAAEGTATPSMPRNVTIREAVAYDLPRIRTLLDENECLKVIGRGTGDDVLLGESAIQRV